MLYARDDVRVLFLVSSHLGQAREIRGDEELTLLLEDIAVEVELVGNASYGVAVAEDHVLHALQLWCEESTRDEHSYMRKRSVPWVVEISQYISRVIYAQRDVWYEGTVSSFLFFLIVLDFYLK